MLPNANYEPQIAFFHSKIEEYKRKGLRIFASSSFQTHSIPMLHILASIDPNIPVYFLETGYHFPETLDYRDQIRDRLGIQVINVESPIPKTSQRAGNGMLYFASDPAYCCYLNKTLPMEPVLAANDIWITGVRRDQNANRKNFDYEAKGPHNTLRFHPMLDWNSRMIWKYSQDHNLPKHPLEDKGYVSIGCAPCTHKMDLSEGGDNRSGRWKGMKKTECGLHTDLIEEKQ